jgi:hypothetical protein
MGAIESVGQILVGRVSVTRHLPWQAHVSGYAALTRPTHYRRWTSSTNTFKRTRDGF